MASSSSINTGPVRINPESEYVRKAKSMNLYTEELVVQVESVVDLLSLKHHKCDITSHIEAQGLETYLTKVLHGPTYETLVKDFWIKAEVYDKPEALEEERMNVMVNPELKGKTREEMGLIPFTKPEIRSTVMGIPVVINEEFIAAAMRCSAEGKFRWDLKENDELKDAVNKALHQGRKKFMMSEMIPEHRILLKIMNECFFQKAGGSDQPKLDHHVFLYFLCTQKKMNVPKYLFYQMIWALRKSQESGRKLVPFGRLLSEIFFQGGLIQRLIDCPVANDEDLQTCTGPVISAKTLKSMQLISKVEKLSTDILPKNAKSDLMKDFPPISKQDNIEVIYEFIKEFYADTGRKLEYNMLPEVAGGADLKVKRRGGKRKASESSDTSKPKKAKKEKKATKQEISEDSSDDELAELDELDDVPLQSTRTRSGQSPAAPTASDATEASEPQPKVQKKRRLKRVKKIQLVDISEEEEEEEEDQMPLIRRKRKLFGETDEAAPTSDEVIERAKQVAGNLGIPVAALVEERTKETAKQVLNFTEVLQHTASEEAGLLLKSKMEMKRESGGADAGIGSTLPGKSSNIVASDTLDSNIPPKPVKPSLDIPITQVFRTLELGLAPTPSSNNPQKPIDIPDDTIDDRCESIISMTDRFCKRMNLPAHHPLQVTNPTPLSIVQSSEPAKYGAEDDLEMSMSPQQQQPEQQQPESSTNNDSPSALHNLEKHISGGELDLTPQKASDEEVATAVASESENQQIPEPERASEAPASHDASEDHTLDLNLSDSSDEFSETNPDKYQILYKGQHNSTTQAEIDAMFDSSDESIIPETNLQTLEIGQSSSQPQSTETTNLPKPPTVLLESTVLKEACNNIFEDLTSLVEASKNPILPADYLEKWDILKEAVDNIFCHLRRLCVERHKEALCKWFEEVIQSMKAMNVGKPRLMLSDAPFFIDVPAITSASIQQEVDPAWVTDLVTITASEATTSESAEEKIIRLQKELMEQKLITEELKKSMAMQRAEFNAREAALERNHYEFKEEMQKQAEKTNKMLENLTEIVTKQAKP